MTLLIIVFCAGCCVGVIIGIGSRIGGSGNRMTLELSRDDVNTLQTGLYALYKGFEYDYHNEDDPHKRKMNLKSAEMWKDLHAKVKAQADRQVNVK